MNTPILIANILTLLAVVAHIFGADKELRACLKMREE